MRFRSLLTTLILFAVGPCFAQGGAQAPASKAPPVEIIGAVQSFRLGQYLVVKPATSPSVWIDLPSNVQFDRSQVKEGVTVVVEATKIQTSYMATQVTIKN
jgi:hypothetical protein